MFDSVRPHRQLGSCKGELGEATFASQGWCLEQHRAFRPGESLACSQEEAGVLGDNVQGQGGEGVGPGHAKEGGFHRMYSGYVSEGWKPW